MKIITTRLDIIKTRATWPDNSFAPAYVFPRKDNKKWEVADVAVSNNPMIWSYAANDEYVRIPLFKYTLPGKGDLSLAVMFQLGLICAGQLPLPIRHLHIVTGVPVELISDNAGNVTGMEYWMGFAIALED